MYSSQSSGASGPVSSRKALIATQRQRLWEGPSKNIRQLKGNCQDASIRQQAGIQLREEGRCLMDGAYSRLSTRTVALALQPIAGFQRVHTPPQSGSLSGLTEAPLWHAPPPWLDLKVERCTTSSPRKSGDSVWQCAEPLGGHVGLGCRV